MYRGNERKYTDDEIIEVIRKHKHESLTYRRLCEILGYSSTSSIFARIKKLEHQGRIKKRTITVIEICEE